MKMPAYAMDPGSAAHRFAMRGIRGAPDAPGGKAKMIRMIWSLGFGGFRAQALSARHSERGRRRTRQDQISLGLKIAGEIADPKIRTERRNLVSSAGPVFVRANSSKIRSSRLT